MPVSPAHQELETGMQWQKSIGVAKRNLAAPHGGEPVEDLDSRRDTHQIVERTKNAFLLDVIPTVNMWCAQTLTLTKAMPTDSRYHCGIAKEGLA